MLVKMLFTADPAVVTAATATSEIRATSNALLDQVLAFLIAHERTQTIDEIHVSPPARFSRALGRVWATHHRIQRTTHHVERQKGNGRASDGWYDDL